MYGINKTYCNMTSKIWKINQKIKNRILNINIRLSSILEININTIQLSFFNPYY